MKNRIFSIIFCCLLIIIASSCQASDQIKLEGTVTTQIAGKSSVSALPSVLRVVDINKNTSGTGFVHKSGIVITAEHVVSSCEVKDIILILSTGQKVRVKSIIKDSNRDLAILHPETDLNVRTLTISQAPTLKIGDQVAAWGFPSGYRGLRALLTVGYLSGEDRPGPENTPWQWVINAAFNSGNSGGPVVRLEDSSVIGVVSSKLAPLPKPTELALKALSETKYGMQYTKREPGKEPVKVSEAQVVADVLEYLRSQTQLVLGFAVKLGELRGFLKENSIEP